MMALLLLLGMGPADLAPGAPELLQSASRLEELLESSAAVQQATLRLQGAWASRPQPKEPCADPERLELGWRSEYFGAAWRETAQASQAEAERLRRLRAAPTVAPLIDVRWATELDEKLKRAEAQRQVFLEASRWQATFVRPALALCPVVEPSPSAGIDVLEAAVRGDPGLPVAVLAIGDGYVCPGNQRADGAVVLLRNGRGCWSEADDCACDIAVVKPGAVLGRVAEETAEPTPTAPPAAAPLPSPSDAPDPEVQTDPNLQILPPSEEGLPLR